MTFRPVFCTILAVTTSFHAPITILFAADIHGSRQAVTMLIEAFEAEKADYLVLLGDLLYGGSWSPVADYASRETARMLNRHADRIIAVQGNCDCEADTNVLDFPLSSEYAVLLLDGRRWFLTHGHHYGPDHLPPLREGDVLAFGHTHVAQAIERQGIYHLNPGSPALPKKHAPPSYGLYRAGRFQVRDAGGVCLSEIALRPT